MSVHPQTKNSNGTSHTIPTNIKNTTNANFFSIINNPNLLSIATHNVQSCVSSNRLQQIEQFFIIFNLDILGLSETHLTYLQARSLNNNLHDKPYKFFFHSSNRFQNCQGVGLLIRNNLCSHLFNQGAFFNRILHLDFQFRNKFKLRIIQVYLPASYHDKKSFKYRLLIQNKLMDLLVQSRRNNFHVILMGDFNIDISRNYNAKSKKILQSFLHNIINFGFLHTISPFTSSFPATYTSTSNSSSSYIDYIFISSSLAYDLVSFDILNNLSFLYTSDHLPLLISLYKNNFFNQSSNAYAKQHKITKQNFLFNKTTLIQWDFFANKMDLIIKTNPKYSNCTAHDLSQSQNTLNAAWDFFVNTVITSAKKHIPKQTTTSRHNSLFTCSNSSIHKHIKKLYKFYYKINKSLIQSSLPLTSFPISLEEHKSVLSIAFQYHISTASIDNHYLANCPLMYLTELKSDIIKPMQAKQQIISRTENNERILEFIKQRNENFHNSPTKMIDSCLERNRKAIVLDRIMIHADTPNQHLELVPDAIKRQTASHFQNIAGSTNRDVSSFNSPNLNPNWKNWERHYEPIETIENDCYSGIMDIPTYDDWLLTLKHLPDHKAPGPSKITNEMLKKLGPKMNRFLYTIIYACFTSSFTPIQWNLAYVNPIPKPKPWNCKLDNTFPITLLDTVRKAFVKILNQRLQNVFIKNNILKGLNFAGLSHQSTMDPLHIVNNILEYHRLNHKFDKFDRTNLYILFQDMSKAYDHVNIHMLRKAMDRLKIRFKFTNVITNLFLNRKNSVFTAFGNTDPYDVIVGIDQGEVISPLL